MGAPAELSNTSSTTFKELLEDAARILEEAGADTPLLDAEILLSEAAGVSRTTLLAHPDYRPDSEAVLRFKELVRLRSQRMPLAYILGRKEFHGLEFEITPAVLVPRPETELLVETAIGILKDNPDPAIADIGLGSGAIAVALAVSLPRARIFGTESSLPALEVARRNAARHRVHERVEMRPGDLFEPLGGLSFDAVVSNPPYIPTGDIPNLQPEVARYEPREALDGGADGLAYYRRIVPEALAFLRPPGALLVEVGAGQSAYVGSLFTACGYADVRCVKDYAGIDRIVLGWKAGRDEDDSHQG